MVINLTHIKFSMYLYRLPFAHLLTNYSGAGFVSVVPRDVFFPITSFKMFITFLTDVEF